MPPKQVNVRIATVENELDFSISQSTLGKQLIDQVVDEVRLREIWFFGLYSGPDNAPEWLKLNKKVLRGDLKKKTNERILLKFRARFFPEEVSEELFDDVTQRLFFIQVKDSILADEIYCPPETCVLLASYAMQAKYGDHNENIHRPSVLANERLLPRRVVEQFHLTAEEWGQRVANWWKEHKGLFKQEAMLEYLKIAQDLDMYGVKYYSIRNKKGTNLFIGINALGINIYEQHDKLTPKIGFPWSEIRNISFKDKKFVIKPMEKSSPDFVLQVPKINVNRDILSLCMGNHELYTRRRQAESAEIRSLKQQAEHKRKERQEELKRIQNENTRREEEISDRNDMHKTIDDLQRKKPPRLFVENDDSSSIEEQSEKAKELDEKRQQIDDAELRLQREREEADREYQKKKERLENDQREKAKLVQEIERTRLKADENAKEAQQKENESRRIEEQLRETNKKVLQAQRQNSTNSSITNSKQEKSLSDDDSDDEDNKAYYHDVELPSNINAPRPEENRLTTVSSDINKKRIIDDERKDLGKKPKQQETPEDKIYRENTIDRGIDKYKTLKKIREGTVKRRIDEFEAM